MDGSAARGVVRDKPEQIELPSSLLAATIACRPLRFPHARSLALLLHGEEQRSRRGGSVRSSRRGSSTPWRQAVVGFLWKHGCEGGASIARVAQQRRATRPGLASSFVLWLGRCGRHGRVRGWLAAHLNPNSIFYI
jgi:hypothetical protein